MTQNLLWSDQINRLRNFIKLHISIDTIKRLAPGKKFVLPVTYHKEYYTLNTLLCFSKSYNSTQSCILKFL